MSEVLLGVFAECKAVERVRVELVRDGFPTDRVELTACCEPGRNAHAEQLLSHDLANQTPQCSVAKPASQWLIGALALCLLLAGYLVARHAFGELGLGVTRSELRLNGVRAVCSSNSSWISNQVPETVTDEIEPRLPAP
jgi:hypothetical protein